MGTRSLTVFKDEQGEELAVLYRQMDGYPEGHGKELYKLLRGAKVINGYSLDDSLDKRVFNGMSCLSAAVIAALKDEIGHFYLYPAGTRDAGEEYIYILSPGAKRKDGRSRALNLRIEDPYDKKVLYDGSLDRWIKNGFFKNKIKPRGTKDNPTKTRKINYREVASSSEPGKTHTVTWNVDGTDFKCQCKGFVFRGTCKHIREIKKELGI